MCCRAVIPQTSAGGPGADANERTLPRRSAGHILTGAPTYQPWVTPAGPVLTNLIITLTSSLHLAQETPVISIKGPSEDKGDKEC